MGVRKKERPSKQKRPPERVRHGTAASSSEKDHIT